MLKGQKKHIDKEQGKTKHEAPRSVNYRATQNKNSHCPREFDRRRWHIGGTLEKISKKLCLNLNVHPGDFGIIVCHMGRELDLKFSKLSNSLGKSALPILGENINGRISLINLTE